jgi:chromosome segregation ATPase
VTTLAVYTEPAPMAPAEGVSLETLETRRNAVENQMFELATRLSARLHGAQERMAELSEALDELVKRSGRMAIEDKTPRVLSLIREAQECIDGLRADAEARQIAQLKSEIGGYEAEILERVHFGARADGAPILGLASWVPG